MTDSRSINISTNDPISFLYMTEQYSIIYTCHIFIIHSSVIGHLGYFHVLANAYRNRHTYVENRRVDAEQEGEGGMKWEMRVDTYALSCVKYTASGNLLHRTGSSALLCGDLEGWDGGSGCMYTYS